MNLNIKSDMLEKTNRNDLLCRAQLITVDMKGDDNRFNYVSLLCNTMSEAAKTGPVKAEFEGMMFVVDKGTTMAQTLQAWKEQAGKPFVEKFSPDILAKRQKNLQQEDLNVVSDFMISSGLKIAEKHNDKGDFRKIFTQEVKNRLSQGKIFNPNAR